MRIGSLFSGGGGGDLGFEQAGHEVVFGAEIDKFARSVFRYHHPNTPIFHDVKEINIERIINERIEFPNIIFGGSPCQDLSRAGKRAGIEGKRSELFFEQIRIADELSTEFVVWENVTGAFDTNGGRDFATVLGTLTGFEPEPSKRWQNAGMCIGPKRNAVWRVLDLQGFGVPQRRRRVFIVANSRTVAPATLVKILFDTNGGDWNSTPGKKTAENDPANVVGSIDRIGESDGRTKSFAPLEIAGVIQNRYWKGFNIESMQAGLAAIVETIAPTKIVSPLVTEPKLVPETVAGDQAAIIATFDEKYSGQYTITPNEHVSTKLKVSSPPAIATDMFVRRLTPLECERLMGWPDGYTENGIDDDGNHTKISDTQRYKIAGNGIGTPVTKWIGDQFMKLEKGEL